MTGQRLTWLLRIAGPAYLVAVGYMDPVNWATDLAAGSRYGYALLFCANRQLMMSLPTPRSMLQLGFVCAGLIIVINGFLLISTVAG